MGGVDVVDLIMADHREVERLFGLLQSDKATRALNFPVVCALLIAHSRAEEEEVYPVAKSEAGETDEVAHSQEEHMQAEQVLERMSAMEPDSAEFDAALQELISAVTHHVEEEESKVLPGMRQRLSEQRRSELGDAFATARANRLGERPGEATREQLAQQARNVGLSGVSSSSKQELKGKLQEQAQQSSE